MTDAISWEVLNATADDWESLEQVHPAVCRFVAPVSEGIVASVIARLVRDGLMEEMSGGVIDPAAIAANPTEFWFRMTPHGREVWEAEAARFQSEAT